MEAAGCPVHPCWRARTHADLQARRPTSDLATDRIEPRIGPTPRPKVHVDGRRERHGAAVPAGWLQALCRTDAADRHPVPQRRRPGESGSTPCSLPFANELALYPALVGVTAAGSI